MAVQSHAVECGCVVVEHAVLAHHYPCGEFHKNVAQAHRSPGSKIVVHAVGTPVPAPAKFNFALAA